MSLSSSLSAVSKAISALRARYVVHAHYYAPEAKSYRCATHYARDWADALQWVASYSYGDTVLVYESVLGIQAKQPCAARGCTIQDIQAY